MVKRTRLALAAVLLAAGCTDVDPEIVLRRLPSGGVQPHVAVDGETVHVVYLKGEAASADVFYIRSDDSAETFSDPVRVNSQAGSAGRRRDHPRRSGRLWATADAFTWSGTGRRLRNPRGRSIRNSRRTARTTGRPLLYSRMGSDGRFEPQRNLMTSTFALDGGGRDRGRPNRRSLRDVARQRTGSRKGRSRPAGLDGAVDGRRRDVRSGNGLSSATESAPAPAAVWDCSPIRRGDLFALYRSARETVHRDIYLLHSTDGGDSFSGRMLDPWEVGACPMSSTSFMETPDGPVGAWETAGQVHFASLTAGAEPLSPPGPADSRKHPRVARDRSGRTMLVWDDGPRLGETERVAVADVLSRRRAHRR